MATCKTCAHNLGGYCAMYSAGIPMDREAVEHQCSQWTQPRFESAADAIQYLDGMIANHPEAMQELWTIRDIISGETNVPASWVAVGWRFLWTWPGFEAATRAELAANIIPF